LTGLAISDTPAIETIISHPYLKIKCFFNNIFIIQEPRIFAKKYQRLVIDVAGLPVGSRSAGSAV
jgi:hypothetical protein